MLPSLHPLPLVMLPAPHTMPAPTALLKASSPVSHCPSQQHNRTPQLLTLAPQEPPLHPTSPPSLPYPLLYPPPPSPPLPLALPLSTPSRAAPASQQRPSVCMPPSIPPKEACTSLSRCLPLAPTPLPGGGRSKSWASAGSTAFRRQCRSVCVWSVGTQGGPQSSRPSFRALGTALPLPHARWLGAGPCSRRWTPVPPVVHERTRTLAWLCFLYQQGSKGVHIDDFVQGMFRDSCLRTAQEKTGNPRVLLFSSSFACAAQL